MGEWKEGLQFGVGKLVHMDGTEYQGNFRDGMKHGKGVMRWAGDKHSYTGYYVRDKKHGHGVERFSNGDI